MLGITFRQLQIFVEAVGLGSFRTCAQRLGITQVSVSGHIAAMERLIGRPLFDRRRGATAQLTEEGRRLYERAVVLLGHVEHFMEEVEAVREHGRARRLIVAGPSYLSFRLTQVFADFALNHPEWQIEYEPTDRVPVTDLVNRGGADVGFLLTPAGQAPDGCTPLWRDPLGLYVGREHPLANRQRVPAAELSAQPLIYLPPRDPLRRPVDATLHAAGISGNPLAILTSNAALARQTLAQGRAMGCLFDWIAEADVASGDLVRVSPEIDLPQTEVSVCRSNRPLVRSIINVLIALVREQAGPAAIAAT